MLNNFFPHRITLEESKRLDPKLKREFFIQDFKKINMRTTNIPEESHKFK